MQEFREREIARAPQARGAFRLYAGGAVIYIGVALDLRAALHEHLHGAHGECTRAAQKFDFEANEDPVALHRRWLAAYGDGNGRLPPCNEEMRKASAPKKPR